MTTLAALPPAPLNFPVWPVHRFSVAQYRRWTEIGRFSEDDNIELLEGWIVDKMAKNPPHDSRVMWTQSVLQRVLSTGWHCRNQCSLETPDSVPEPDLAIVRGSILDYQQRHPQAPDTALVIEVADTSVAIDRAKRHIYARAGIPEYWIINLVEAQVEVFKTPHVTGRNADYQHEEILGRLDQITLAIPGEQTQRIAVADFVP